jgi:hypothetical protein
MPTAQVRRFSRAGLGVPRRHASLVRLAASQSPLCAGVAPLAAALTVPLTAAARPQRLLKTLVTPNKVTAAAAWGGSAALTALWLTQPFDFIKNLINPPPPAE